MPTTKLERIRDLRTILEWEGVIDNTRIREALGVQPVWASRLLGALVSLMGDAVTRETSHSPVRMRPGRRKPAASADDYLRVALQDVQPVSPVEEARAELAAVDSELFALLVDACRDSTGVSITYYSMSSPQGTQRVIFPHTLVRAPRRWHVRAWCAQRHDFRDFALGRIAAAKLVKDASPMAQRDDRDWVEEARLTLQAHPLLSSDQRSVIEREYFRGATSRNLSVRRCLAAYILQDLRVAIDAMHEKPPQFQLALADPVRGLRELAQFAAHA